jgi:predicted nucleic acid-binding protein
MCYGAPSAISTADHDMALLHRGNVPTASVGRLEFSTRAVAHVETNQLQFYALSEIELGRMRLLMEKYKDTPMDLADASLVAAAESLDSPRIFTLDSDFYIYRFRDKGAFEVIPSPA